MLLEAVGDLQPQESRLSGVVVAVVVSRQTMKKSLWSTLRKKEPKVGILVDHTYLV